MPEIEKAAFLPGSAFGVRPISKLLEEGIGCREPKKRLSCRNGSITGSGHPIDLRLLPAGRSSHGRTRRSLNFPFAVTTSLTMTNKERGHEHAERGILPDQIESMKTGLALRRLPNAAIATYVYGYDNANRVTTEVNAEGTVTYTYDSGGELLTARGSRTENYSYDSGGNRNMSGYTTGTGNELTSGGGYTFTYDKNGNTIGETQLWSGDVWTFGYDDRNRMISAVEKSSGGTILNQATYTYDALDRRIGVDDNGTQTWTIYNGTSADANPYADFNGSGTLLTRYVSGLAVDELFARTSSGGTLAWYLTDRLGSVGDIVNSSGTVIDHIVYDSYGDILSETSPSNGDRFKFAGMEWDAAIGEYYDHARSYGPSLGRFFQTDPTGFRGDSTNLYSYVGNAPIDLVDTTGESPQNSGGTSASNRTSVRGIRAANDGE